MVEQQAILLGMEAHVKEYNDSLKARSLDSGGGGGGGAAMDIQRHDLLPPSPPPGSSSGARNRKHSMLIHEKKANLKSALLDKKLSFKQSPRDGDCDGNDESSTSSSEDEAQGDKLGCAFPLFNMPDRPLRTPATCVSS